MRKKRKTSQSVVLGSSEGRTERSLNDAAHENANPRELSPYAQEKKQLKIQIIEEDNDENLQTLEKGKGGSAGETGKEIDKPEAARSAELTQVNEESQQAPARSEQSRADGAGAELHGPTPNTVSAAATPPRPSPGEQVGTQPLEPASRAHSGMDTGHDVNKALAVPDGEGERPSSRRSSRSGRGSSRGSSRDSRRSSGEQDEESEAEGSEDDYSSAGRRGGGRSSRSGQRKSNLDIENRLKTFKTDMITEI